MTQQNLFVPLTYVAHTPSIETVIAMICFRILLLIKRINQIEEEKKTNLIPPLILRSFKHVSILNSRIRRSR
jgi:hypothetical protein